MCMFVLQALSATRTTEAMAILRMAVTLQPLHEANGAICYRERLCVLVPAEAGTYTGQGGGEWEGGGRQHEGENRRGGGENAEGVQGGGDERHLRGDGHGVVAAAPDDGHRRHPHHR